jgi:cobalt-zinc-cadmium efflux system outer membrane protein
MNRRLVAAWVVGVLSVFLISTPVVAAVDWNSPLSLVATATEGSPLIREVKARGVAARERLKAAGALPNPTLTAGVENQPIDLSRDRSFTVYTVGASQLFIRGEKRKTLREAAESDVRRIEAEEETLRAEIRMDVLLAYDEAAGAQSQINASEEIAKLSAMLTSAARIRYETGAGLQLDVIRARLEEDHLQQFVLDERGQREGALARLRALLNVPEDEVIPPFTHGRGHRQRPVVTADFIMRATFILDAELARATAEVQLAKLQRKPDPQLEVRYGYRPWQKDFFSVMGRVELPIRRATVVEPRIQEEIARRDAAEARVAILRQELRAELGAAIAEQKAAGQQMTLHASVLVPEAKLAFDSALASYQNGKAGLDAVLSALRTYRQLNVDYYGLLLRQYVAEDQIEGLIHGARRGARRGARSESGSAAAVMGVR